MAVNILLVHDMLEAFRKENLLRSASEEVSIEALSCADSGELCLWLAGYSDRVDGMLFTNALLLDTMRRRNLLPNVPCELVLPSGGDLLRLTTVRSGGLYRGSLSRVMIDIGPGGAVFNEILQTQFRPMIPAVDSSRSNLDVPLASLLWERYRNAWDSGAFDLIIMNHNDMTNPLRMAGINAWCLLPGVETIFSAAERMALSVTAAQMSDRSPVFVILSDRSGRNDPKRLCEIAERFDTAHERCFRAVPKAETLELYGFGIERRKLLNGSFAAELRAEMTASAGNEIIIGWGIGVTMPHAVTMAQRAYRESLFDLDACSFLVTETGELFGPFGAGSVPALQKEHYNHLRERAQQSGVSSVTLHRLLQAKRKLGSDVVTSDEISHCLGITRRSASRLLTTLTAHGAAELCKYTDDATRGRPAKRYRLLI